MNRLEIKEQLLKEYKTYQGVAKYIGYSKTYTFDCLNNVVKGTLEFWNYCLDVLGVRMKPDEKAITLINLLQEYEDYTLIDEE